jgi:hypothetical protein
MPQFVPVASTDRETLHIVISNPVTIFALVILNLQAVRGGESRLPCGNKPSRLIVGNEIVVRIIGEQDDASLCGLPSSHGSP